MDMNLKILPFFVLISIGTSCTKYTNKYQNEHEEMMGSTAMTYNLNTNEILEMKIKSDNGNAEASLRLSKYYSLTLNDIDWQMYYLERSAIQGSSIGQYNYAFFLSYNLPAYKKYYNIDKAIYWLGVAAKNGNVYAENRLQQIISLKDTK